MPGLWQQSAAGSLGIRQTLSSDVQAGLERRGLSGASAWSMSIFQHMISASKALLVSEGFMSTLILVMGILSGVFICTVA